MTTNTAGSTGFPKEIWLGIKRGLVARRNDGLCKRGHEYDGRDALGSRVCSKCRNETRRLRRARKGQSND